MRIFSVRCRTFAWISSEILMAREAFRSKTYDDLSCWNSSTAWLATSPIDKLMIRNMASSSLARRPRRFIQFPDIEAVARFEPL